MRKQIVLVAAASVLITAAGLSWLARAGDRRADIALAKAAISGTAPAFESPVWAVEEEAALDKWSSWQMSTYKPSKTVTCWRFLVLPRNAPGRSASDESVGRAACSGDRAQRYSVTPRRRACQLIGDVPPWRDRFVRADDFENSACAATA